MVGPGADSLSYQVIYDVRHAMPNTWFLSLAFLLVFMAGLALYRRASSFRSSRPGLVGLGLMLMGGAWVLFAIGATIIPYVGMRLHLSRGQYRVAEGIVHDFQAGASGDHREESWTLQTPSGVVRYAYSPSLLEAGYNQTAPRGGQIRNGVQVRLFDVDGRIARLEIVR
jgi:hypothetical protein